GGLELVDVAAAGPELTISPITPASAPVVLGEELRDLGAAVGVRLVRALDGSVELDGGTLHVRLPHLASSTSPTTSARPSGGSTTAPSATTPAARAMR